MFRVKQSDLNMADSWLISLQRQLQTAAGFRKLIEWARTCSAGDKLQVTSASGSLPALLLAHLFQVRRRTVLCVSVDLDVARCLYSDLRALEVEALYFPASGCMPYDPDQVANTAPMVRRQDVLQQMAESAPTLVIASLEALQELMPQPAATQGQSRTVRVDEEIAPADLVAELSARGFERVSFVAEPGELAWRGGILDIFPFSGGWPVRLEYYGNQIESIREFDVTSQRSVSQLSSARLVPRPEDVKDSGPWVSLLDCLSADALLSVFGDALLKAEARSRYEHALTRYQATGPDAAPPESRFLDEDTLVDRVSGFARVVFNTAAPDSTPDKLAIGGRPQPAFGGRLNRFRAYLGEHKSWRIHILCDSEGQKKRLEALLEDAQSDGTVQLHVGTVHRGFQLPELLLAIYTDHEFFGRHYRPRTRKLARSGGLRLHQLNSLRPGDYVVHTSFGIGRFAGFRKIRVTGQLQECVEVTYANDDTVYVNVNALHKLHRYSGKEGQTPALTRLGSGQWERAKSRAKKRIKDIARDLIRLYAQRKASKGYAFASDSVWQQEMEASFEWQDTPDQYAAAEAVKRDMEAEAPMDRLICGDVGFGKTEVAIRAAFKAVCEHRQVAILVPTTVLARQHYHTLRRRLTNFPVRVEVLSRYITGKAAKSTVKDLAEGRIDIIIGTHRLVSGDVVFKDLGLLIIDEEQRFGVRIKEKLRQLRVNVDTLTLTATPIPRTLQFSLMGARDLSIINTAPPNRQPIQTEIHSTTWSVVRDAIEYEISRGGQVFFIHNRVQSIGEIADKLRNLLPGVRLAVAHGQMKARELEKVMTAFVAHSVDLLVSTSIVENGLDIANANTMIIHNAHRFGLAEIHQLRGRVGRSDRKAFCYLLVPSVSDLTRRARQRLQAVEQLSDLGSGFDIAMRDLDIRGAGNVLGGEQSGFIADLGLSTYHNLLEQAVHELRSEEFAEQFRNLPTQTAIETVVDVAVNACLPEEYISHMLERLSLYRQIAGASSPEELDAVRTEIIDRFGPLPKPAEQLFRAAGLRLCGQRLLLARIRYRNRRLFLHFPDPEVHPGFQRNLLPPLLDALQASGRTLYLKESDDKRMRAIVQNVTTLDEARALLEDIAGRVTLKTD